MVLRPPLPAGRQGAGTAGYRQPESDQAAAVVDKVTELLHRLYPGQTWLQRLLPDLRGRPKAGGGLARARTELDRSWRRLAGAPRGIRTPDLLLRRQLLYPLS